MVLIMKHRLPFSHTQRTKASSVRGEPTERDEISLKLASSKAIKRWATTRFHTGTSIGALTSGETLHYRTLKPIFGGLFCERIFGPVTDWECHCGRVRY